MRKPDSGEVSAESRFPQSGFRSPLSGIGGKGIRTPDIQLAKLALYQLSYAPELKVECKWAAGDCNRQGRAQVARST